MRKTIYLILILAQLLPIAAKADTLQFAAAVRNEDLAEEAISLLHCLAERTGSNWEFTGTATGAHTLKVHEDGTGLKGLYRRAEKETAFFMNASESETICNKLEPAADEISFLKENGLSPLNEVSLPNTSLAEPSKKAYWPWLAAAGAAALTGFIVWRSRRPDYRSVQMN